MSLITAQQLANACHITPALAEQWLPALLPAMAKFEVNTPLRISEFLPQLAHESWGFTRGRENLNYSAQALLAMWPSRFDPTMARQYARKPEDIANIAYANREGNGPRGSGDGWRYRGGGPLGLTFRNNYRACEKATGLPFVSHPEIIEQPEAGALAAGWFWSVNQLNLLADAGQFDAICDLINIGHRTKPIGDSHGYKERLALRKSARAALGVK